jgi:glycosyltransferase involved in cell wall biosynthesis
MLPDMGGASIYCYELAKGLAQLGHEVHVFAHKSALRDPSYTLHPILTRNLAVDLDLLDRFEMDVWHSLYFFYAPLALRKPRVFITGHGDDFFGFRLRFSWPNRTRARRQLIWRLPQAAQQWCEDRLDVMEQRFNHRIFADAVRHARQVIAVSTFSRDRFCESYPEGKGKTTVIPPGVNEAFFRERERPLGRRRLLTVTRLDAADRIKNVHGVIEALGRLKDQFDFEYDVVAGDQRGGYREEVEELIRHYHLEHRVRIHSRLPLADLIQHYREADLFALVSYAEPQNFEGFGMVFLEANAAGTPVLTSRQGGMADYVEEGVNGFYVEDPSPAGIEQALRHFFEGDVVFRTEEVKRKPMDYRWPMIAKQVADTYDRHWN